ncbi:spidroin-2-like [Myiozetetes cayanensis]|uniref:spidroin-2-like n=1 Tax=Myiozetetes cayanensis TaxID=478635 RepID=UPI002160D64B|nr:spidroin-2-like [Myiozetetes cayanensis]
MRLCRILREIRGSQAFQRPAGQTPGTPRAVPNHGGRGRGGGGDSVSGPAAAPPPPRAPPGAAAPMPRGRRRSRRRRRAGPAAPLTLGTALAGRREEGRSRSPRDRAGIAETRWVLGAVAPGSRLGLPGLEALAAAAGPRGGSPPWAAPSLLQVPAAAQPAPRRDGSDLPAGAPAALAVLRLQPGAEGSARAAAGAAPRLRTVYVNPRWLERQAALGAAAAAASPCAEAAAAAAAASGAAAGPATGPAGGPAPAAAPAAAAAGQGEAAAEAPATPYVGLRRPLGYKLAKATKERIWRGEFIDLFSLLHTELAPEHGPRPGDTLDQWVSAFLVYASVLCEKHPARCGAMFKYLDTIRKLHATYGGTSWMNYDEDFRRRAAKNPSLPWGDVDLDLWMKWMAPLKSLLPRHSRAESETQPSPAPPPPPAQSPKQEEKSQTP